MADKNPSNLVYDALADFSAGMDSGSDPFSLPKKQLAFALNTTVRGEFATNRPAVQKQSLLDAVWQTIQSVGIFQGACYAAPDTGQQMLVAQIGGRLFTFTPDTIGTNVSVAEVTIPGDPNPSGLPQAWLKNAERWVIVNNGINNPIFFDLGSNTSRRSVTTSTSQAVTSVVAPLGQFITPAISGTVVVPLNGANNLENFVNQAVQLVEYDQNGVVTATTNYEVVAVGGAIVNYNVTLENLSDTAGATQGAGTGLIIQPNIIGTIVGAVVTNVSPLNPIVLTLSTPAPSSVGYGTFLTINGDSGYAVTKVLFGGLVLHMVHVNPTPTLNFGDLVFLTGVAQPSITIGNLATDIIAPAVGSFVVTTLQAAYTGTIGQVLYLNGKQYKVTAANTTTVVSADSVTLLNLNDSRAGHVFNVITSPVSTSATQIFNFPELPPGRNMEYNQGRVWEALTDAISFIAGDIVGGSSGSPAYNGRDAILKVSENSLLANGGSFKVPSNLGQITAMKAMAQLDASLGQGALMVVTPVGVFSCNAPPDRTLWAAMTSPIVSESLIGLGGLSQNSTIVVNGDLLFRSVDGIRSLIMGRRDFWSWGNAPISYEMRRVIDNDNVAGLAYASAVQFDNRMLMTAVPTQGPQGVYHQGLMALNFDPVSKLGKKSEPVYDGFWTGMNVLQMIEGQFSGVHRCFCFTYSATENQIQLYEVLKTGELDNETIPIVWAFESPVLFKEEKNKGFYDLVSLENGEIYVKDIQPGQTVSFLVEYRPDYSTCWFPWITFSVCNDQNSSQSSYGAPFGLGKPTAGKGTGSNSLSSNFGRWFQVRITVNGHCVFMGAKFMAALQPQPMFQNPQTAKPKTTLVCPIV